MSQTPVELELELEKAPDDLSMYEEYFYLTQKHKKEQGERTVVLLNCGIFYEIYGYANEQGDVIGSDIVEVCQICDLVCTEKSKIKYNNQTLYQAGFRDFVSDKFLNMIIDGGYTAVMYIQTDEINIKTKKKIRRLEAIHSAGTYIPIETNDHKLNNHIMVLWFEKGNFRQKAGNKQESIVYGMALLNVYNGKTYMYEDMITETKIQSTTFDELEKNISIFRPSEIVLISNLPTDTTHLIKQYTGIHQGNPTIHEYDFQQEDIKNCGKQSYIRHILTSQFGDNIWESCEEFQMYPYAVQAFCYLVHFIQSRNANLIRRIEIPVFQNKSSYMTLANHTLRQLNILSDHPENGRSYGHLSSVGSFLNKCSCAMGKRKFQYILTHPSHDRKWLQHEYHMMDQMMSGECVLMIEPLRKQIGKIRDLEKTGKMLLNRKLTASNVYQLYESVEHTQQINMCVAEMDWLREYLCPGVCMETQTQEVIHFLNSKLKLDVCKNSANKTTYDENIIQPGVSEYLDKTLGELELREAQIRTIETYFNNVYNRLSSAKKPTDVIKVVTSEKHIVSLQVTKTRSDVLKKERKSATPIQLDNDVRFEWKEVQFVNSNKTNNEVSFPLLDRICRDITRIKNELNSVIHEVFLQVLSDLEERYYPHLEHMSMYISSLDVLLTKCHVAKTYKYCRPTIDRREQEKEKQEKQEKQEQIKSFIRAKNMKHVLIEQLQQTELYVPNDITIGSDETNGILLYGTNAVGKSSLIKSIGICVIMAQAGMYVPCSEFHYEPYTAIYSRIIGNDNLFKGLSTYAVEISELRTILNNADSNSLVLGDELCSGTETVSALSVVMASLTALDDRRTSFILASHFHELVQYDELKARTHIKLKHMEVYYDKDNDCLVYDRKLKDGPGQRTYGLEVCKSLYFPEDVLTHAYQIRQKYHPEFKGVLSQKQTHYNAKKIKDQCEMCQSTINLEIHHLQEQHKADEDGFIDGQFHKNHPANLVTLCETCHDAFHHNHDHNHNHNHNHTNSHTQTHNTPTSTVSSISETTVETKPRTVRKLVKRKTTKGVMLQDIEVSV